MSINRNGISVDKDQLDLFQQGNVVSEGVEFHNEIIRDMAANIRVKHGGKLDDNQVKSLVAFIKEYNEQHKSVELSDADGLSNRVRQSVRSFLGNILDINNLPKQDLNPNNGTDKRIIFDNSTNDSLSNKEKGRAIEMLNQFMGYQEYVEAFIILNRGDLNSILKAENITIQDHTALKKLIKMTMKDMFGEENIDKNMVEKVTEWIISDSSLDNIVKQGENLEIFFQRARKEAERRSNPKDFLDQWGISLN